jgi:hypothetical protein
MMTAKSLEERISDTLKEEPGAPTPYDEAVTTLEKAAGGIQRSLSPEAEAVQVRLEPSYRVNLGDQYRMVIRIPAQGFNDVLFRAYVPEQGFPVTLDLFDDDAPSCPDVAALEQEIVKFLEHKDVKRRLLALKKLAA